MKKKKLLRETLRYSNFTERINNSQTFGRYRALITNIEKHTIIVIWTRRKSYYRIPINITSANRIIYPLTTYPTSYGMLRGISIGNEFFALENPWKKRKKTCHINDRSLENPSSTVVQNFRFKRT